MKDQTTTYQSALRCLIKNNVTHIVTKTKLDIQYLPGMGRERFKALHVEMIKNDMSFKDGKAKLFDVK